MALEQKLNLRLSQRLVMMPSLQQAIKLLQMSKLELQDVLTQEIVENPLLEEEEETAAAETTPEAEAETAAAKEAGVEAPPAQAEAAEAPAEKERDSFDEIDFDSYFEDYLDSAYNPRQYEDTEQVPLENTLSRPQGLPEHLNWQLSMSDAPAPVREVAQYLVGNIDDEYVIQLNEDGLPKLRISAAYRRMLRGGNGAIGEEAATYLKDKMRSAVWLIKSLDQRQRTIYKVADSIVRHQREFLENGIEYLRPLVLRDVANDIGMHESTVSRVVSNKYIHTPRGLFPMKYFFHSGIDSTQGSEVSSLSIKSKIAKIVSDEDAARPHSDARIMQKLRAEGIQIARRTVAKYREELRIPSSSQ